MTSLKPLFTHIAPFLIWPVFVCFAGMHSITSAVASEPRFPEIEPKTEYALSFSHMSTSLLSLELFATKKGQTSKIWTKEITLYELKDKLQRLDQAKKYTQRAGLCAGALATLVVLVDGIEKRSMMAIKSAPLLGLALAGASTVVSFFLDGAEENIILREMNSKDSGKISLGSQELLELSNEINGMSEIKNHSKNLFAGEIIPHDIAPTAISPALPQQIVNKLNTLELSDNTEKASTEKTKIAAAR